MGYHLRPIEPQGVYGTFEKILEEVDELKEGLEQANKVLAICEMCDLYGALEAFALQFAGLSMQDLKLMSDATKRSFQDGSRTPK